MSFSSILEELHGINSQELSKLLRESGNYTLNIKNGNGSLMQLDIKRLAVSLPLHLLAVLLLPDSGDETRLTHLLSGVRILHTLSDLASKTSEIEQILMEELRTSEQILDLVFFTFVMLAGYPQENHAQSLYPVLHSTLLTCNLFLLTSYISTQWQDLVNVLLVHPKVDIFMNAAFDAMHMDIIFFQQTTFLTDASLKTINFLDPESEAHIISHQCEASLQFLMFLCQHKSFRERLLRNKDLCRNGSILSLALAVLKLNICPHLPESSCLTSVVSRMKSKVLSILVQLCETESTSYLDEVASSSRSMQLAKSVALEVLSLLKTAFSKKCEELNGSIMNKKPKGHVVLNSMRLADIFSDDSNFHSFMTINITPVLADILSLSHDEFISNWCSIETLVLEEDATVEYEPFSAAGVVILSVQRASGALTSEAGGARNSYCSSVSCTPPVSYAQQKTSFLVKIFANLHCFVPNICGEEERNQFFNKFVECLGMEHDTSSQLFPESESRKTIIIYGNLCSLLDHAVSLIPVFLNEEDVQLLSVFIEQFSEILPPSYKPNATGDVITDNVKRMRENKSKAVHKTPQSSQSWERFSNHERHKDFQGGNISCSSLSKKVDNAEHAPDYKGKSGDFTEGFSDTSLFQEVDQLNVMNKQKSPVKSQLEVDRVMVEEQKPATRTVGCEKEARKDTKPLEGNSVVKKNKSRPEEVSSVVQGQFTKTSEFMNDNECKGSTHRNERVEAVETEDKQPRKRKRNIMNEKQINLIEGALIEEPELQRNAALLQSWTEKLNTHGSEVTSSQLKNWLNNRKARLARAAREARAPSEGENALQDKACGSSTANFCDSSESNGDEYYVPTRRCSGHGAGRLSSRSKVAKAEACESMPPEFPDFASQHSMQTQVQMHCPPARYSQCEPGQRVCIMDTANGKEVGRGLVYQIGGKWHELNLEEARALVVEVSELKVERWTVLPHPSDSGGATFEEAEAKNGKIRVAWDVNKIFVVT